MAAGFAAAVPLGTGFVSAASAGAAAAPVMKVATAAWVRNSRRVDMACLLGAGAARQRASGHARVDVAGGSYQLRAATCPFPLEPLCDPQLVRARLRGNDVRLVVYDRIGLGEACRLRAAVRDVRARELQRQVVVVGPGGQVEQRPGRHHADVVRHVDAQERGGLGLIAAGRLDERLPFPYRGKRITRLSAGLELRYERQVGSSRRLRANEHAAG